jgi:hypothetical protein
MALTKCHECGHEVSTQANACPTCGAPVKKPSGARLVLFLAAVLGVLILIGLATRDRSTSDLPSGPPAQAPAATSTTPTKPPDSPPPIAPEVKAARVVKEFPSYQVSGRRWRNIVVSPDNSLEALTALAKRLHAEDPKSSFEFFTDGDAQQFRRYMRWASRPAGSNPAQYPYSRDWAERHGIAILQDFNMGLPHGRRWPLKLEIYNGEGVKPHVPWGTTVDLE